MSSRETREESPWYVTAFQGGYAELYAHRDFDSARREARWLVEQGVRGRVLDLCCGFGRHALALSELGCDVYGLDLSSELLLQARNDPRTRDLSRRFVRGDARALPFAGASFDTVVVLFSSFGYFGREGDARMLGEIARVVRPGGLVVLDVMNPERVRAALVPHSTSERGGVVLDERRRIESAVDGSLTVVKNVEQRFADGRVVRWSERVGLYASAELERLARGHALHPQRTHGDFDATPFSPAAPRQIVFLRRA
ncbi:MAG: class I SAM-dependent methyltransferase [Planctomycetes bacterium]|nr:class I SAM-dependent methyltransferase [Planctomycetota bacterium]